ncbi:type II secretion system F family protein [Halodesulfovibrio sp.]|uniref:type II secretion system F family protein n=1 Tax=Halodesulfovibrio sp. TaxID=1912772 RepID=UPI0025B95027|nr:type II secretion system F family protein [Halodesulfovibrio sp.]
MPSFSYKAVNKAGRNTKGILEADNETHAVKIIRQKKLYPVKVQKLGDQSRKQNVFPDRKNIASSFVFQRVSKSTVASTIKQLSTLLNAGLPLETCLSTLIEQGGKSPMRSVLSQVRDSIREGAGLAAAFAEFPNIFSPTFVTMIKAAETSGTLEIVMERLAEHAEQQVTFNRKLQSTLAYPILMLLVGAGVVTFLLVFVVPKVTQIFMDLNRALPLPTQLLLTVSDFLHDNWLYLAAVIAISVFSFKLFITTSKGKHLHHTQTLKIPLTGTFLRLLIIGRVCRTLGMLLKNGVSLIEALTIVRNVAGNIVVEQTMDAMSKGVQEGKTLAGIMQHSFIFPSSATQMVAAGEKSGQLAQMLLVIADDCDAQVNTKLQILTSLMEPVLILLLGGIVGFIVMAIILPIFEISSLVG